MAQRSTTNSTSAYRTQTPARAGRPVQQSASRAGRPVQRSAQRTAARPAQQRTRGYFEDREYIEGNAVRRVRTYVEPAFDPFEETEKRDIEEIKREKRTRAVIKKNQEKARLMSPGFVLFLSLVCVLGMFICVRYLQAQAEVTSNAHSIERLESELREIRTLNDYQENEINASVDINNIYNTAVNELGMVYPARGQVISYEASATEYVRQADSLG